jgi:hypothetical protein
MDSERGFRGPTVRVYTAPPAQTVLMVDDEPALRRAAARILERRGFTVLVAADGLEALELFHAHEDDIGLIVSDLAMPRMGGVELYRALRREGKRVPFLLTSGYAAADLRQASVDASIPVVEKPWSVEELVRAVGELLRAGTVH